MKKTLAAAVLLLLAAPLRAAEQDVANSKDLPLFTRMPGFFIDGYEEREFEQYAFSIPNAKARLLEGRRTRVHYHQRKDEPATKSALQVLRNFDNAARAMGCTVFTNDHDWASYDCSKNGREVWAHASTSGNAYELIMVEKQEMKQEVKGNGDWAPVLEREGRVALYLNFDVDKAEIRPDSNATIDEIVKVLLAHPDWKIGVEGHTDNTGDAAHNKQLSQARAQSVVAAITAKGIDGKRLSAAGFGSEFPIADNRNEAGRARNRRVELVKK